MALEKKFLTNKKAAPSNKTTSKKMDSSKLMTAKTAPRVVTAKIWGNS